MKKARKLIGIILSLALVIGMLSACGGDAPTGEGGGKQYLRISCGPSGGFIYTMFAGISNLVMEDHPDAYDIQLDISTGTSENARNVITGAAQLSMVGLDVIKDAYDGTGEFEGMEPEQILHVMSGPPAIVHIMVPEGSDAKSIEDLVGLRVGVGMGVMSTYLPILFEALGLPTDTTPMTELSITDMCNGLADGTIDAGIYATPYPTSSISDLSMTSGLELIPIPADVVAKVAEKYPFFYEEMIPAGAYNGVDYDLSLIHI